MRSQKREEIIVVYLEQHLILMKQIEEFLCEKKLKNYIILKNEFQKF
jgi:hypothetical protein